MSQQTDQPKRSSWKRRALIAFVLLLPVQYVLAVGPLTRLEQEDLVPGFVSQYVTGPLYAPIRWLMVESPTVRESIKWYNRLWKR